MSYRNVCFTLNNYTQEEFDKLKTLKTVRYMVIGEEVGENGTPHLQGYIEFTNSKKLVTLKNINERIHWERRFGTAKQAANYCKKDGKFIEIGSISQQGRRSDLDDVVEMVESGSSTSEIASAFPKTYLMYGNGIEKLRAARFEDRTEPPCVTWLWGLTGTGKTRTAVESHPTYYIKDGTKWWSGYEQQEAIIIDDFDGDWPYRNFLRLLDRYPYQGEFKGGSVKINSPFIYITCEFPPEHFWSGNELAQVLRRITTVTHLEAEAEAEAEVTKGNTASLVTLDGCRTDQDKPTFDRLTDI